MFNCKGGQIDHVVARVAYTAVAPARMDTLNGPVGAAVSKGRDIVLRMDPPSAEV
jgi:hypothetical protein